MNSKSIRVLVVDDSAMMREILMDSLNASPGIEVIGTAADGNLALLKVAELKPDVVTLDIQMPGMDGLATLEAILAKNPLPVIMVSSLTQIGATTTFEALEKGALDYVGKPESGSEAAKILREELPRKIKAMAGMDVRRMLQIRKERNARIKGRVQEQKQQREQAIAQGKQQDSSGFEMELADKCIAIGISTGGPPALADMFQALKGPLPPIVVVQHMPAHFTGPFAWRLNSISQLSIKEAATGDILKPNHVLIAPGGKHLSLKKQGSVISAVVQDGEPVSGHKPSVDVMMKSAASIFGDRCLGLVMTGMGRDGSDGCGAIRAAGGYVLGQDDESSDVYGMNKVAFVEGNVDKQFSLEEAPTVITSQVKRLWGRSPVGAT